MCTLAEILNLGAHLLRSESGYEFRSLGEAECDVSGLPLQNHGPSHVHGRQDLQKVVECIARDLNGFATRRHLSRPRHLPESCRQVFRRPWNTPLMKVEPG